MATSHKVGTVGWVDLTVPNADDLRDFYTAVVGWATSEVPMGEFADYLMHPEEGADPVAGVCHARGVNAKLPPVWLVYFTVEDLGESIAECERLGGQVLAGPAGVGGGRYCVIRDPAGAIAALYCASSTAT
jgi:predicted enzyme related to lactoylglutathione lyase